MEKEFSLYCNKSFILLLHSIKEMKHIKPIETFDNPQDALRHYLTMVAYFKSKVDQGLFSNIIWEVTLSSGSIHSEGHSVYVNIIKDDFKLN